MGTGAGYKAFMGMAKQAAFRTAIVATDKIPIESETLKPDYSRIESEWLDGKAGRRGDEQGPLSVAGNSNIVLCHDEVDSGEFVGCNLPLAIAMGTPTWDAGSGSNRIRLAESPSTPATIALEKTVSVHEVVGAMCKGFTISSQSAQDVKCAFDWVGYDYEFASPVNSSSDLSTLPAVIPGRLLFGDMVFRMATDMSDALAVGDKVSISAFSLNYLAGMSDPEFASPLNAVSDPYGTDAGLTMKPERNDFREVTLEITIPRYTADTWETAKANDSAIQGDFVFTASATRKFYIYLPYMKVVDVSEPIGGPGFIVQTVSLKCFRGKAYSGGAGNTFHKFLDASTTVDEEFAIETDNDRTAVIF